MRGLCDSVATDGLYAVSGVGGLVLGGGFGHLSGEYGFAVDNLRAATIVTASGQTVRASAEDNPDLFWAIRGGGCNFGVVTEFELKMHPQRRTVFAGVIVYPGTVEVLRGVMKVMEDWWDAGPERESIIQFLTLGPDGNVSPPKAFYIGCHGLKGF